MSNRTQCEQLLERIDAVLTECGKDPRSVPARIPPRPVWSGPSWATEQQAVHVSGFRRNP